MFRIFIVLFFAIGLLTSGCKTERSGRPHQGCHRVGSHRPGHSGSIHHHYAKPKAFVDEKVK